MRAGKDRSDYGRFVDIVTRGALRRCTITLVMAPLFV